MIKNALWIAPRWAGAIVVVASISNCRMPYGPQSTAYRSVSTDKSNGTPQSNSIALSKGMILDLSAVLDDASERPSPELVKRVFRIPSFAIQERPSVGRIYEGENELDGWAVKYFSGLSGYANLKMDVKLKARRPRSEMRLSEWVQLLTQRGWRLFSDPFGPPGMEVLFRGSRQLRLHHNGSDVFGIEILYAPRE
jgi:hypothetical protein